MKPHQLDIQTEIEKRKEAEKPYRNGEGELAPFEPGFLCEGLGHTYQTCLYGGHHEN